jgi:hypothetical protein
LVRVLLRSAELLPLGSRIRRRLVLEYASRDELLQSLEHLLATAEDYEDAEAVTVDPDGTLLVLVDDAGTWRVVALRR